MAFESKVVDYVKKSLEDERCIGAVIHLEELLTGYDKIGESYTRLETVDGKELKTIQDVIGEISEENLLIERVRVRKERFYNSLSGARVTAKNIIVNVKEARPGDNSIRLEFGVGKKNLVFIMSYFADNDTDLKLKINYLDLVDYKEEEVDEDQ